MAVRTVRSTSCFRGPTDVKKTRRNSSLAPPVCKISESMGGGASDVALMNSRQTTRGLALESRTGEIWPRVSYYDRPELKWEARVIMWLRA
jgi:hypothetical protein